MPQGVEPRTARQEGPRQGRGYDAPAHSIRPNTGMRATTQASVYERKLRYSRNGSVSEAGSVLDPLVCADRESRGWRRAAAGCRGCRARLGGG
eukprot:scaffold14618_cov16-Tisochrysis_lutea.AAC.1